ncbi:MAG: DNA alkylation repair protein [Candidatus Gracilibacteria bacterium]|jgi:3-methyladenine DNA glycosylase AlkD
MTTHSPKVQELKQEIMLHANPVKATLLQRFFKTGPGQYGEGDKFAGINVPIIRQIAQKYQDLTFDEIDVIIKSTIHEERLAALLILVAKYEKGQESVQKAVFDFYMMHLDYINNWDLVDLSADKIIGAYLFEHAPIFQVGIRSFKPTELLEELADSKNMWHRRISVLATFYFIKKNQFVYAFQIATMLLKDKHDLIHKAVGWMLREIGKRSQEAEEYFLKLHYKKMPRTMLRYAIERFPEELRQAYLKGKI